jgi:lysozyme
MRWFLLAVICLSLTAFSGINYSHILKNYQVHGIDVSHHQQQIHWEKVVAHPSVKVSFCFIKATEGSTFKDHRYQLNWTESKKAGLLRGAYHFYISAGNPRTQAQHFIRQVKLENGDLAPVLDVEQDTQAITPYQFRKNLKIWLNTVENHYGIKPIIYTNPYMYNKFIKGYFKEYPLWIADYNSLNIFSKIKDTNLKFWQYTERGKITGIRGYVDYNAFLGDLEDFTLHQVCPSVDENF